MLGLAGLFLPFLQGWLFLVLGIFLLAPHIKFFGLAACWIHRRFPRMRYRIARLRKKLGLRGKESDPCTPTDGGRRMGEP